jgi:hypothetical protein
VENMSSAWSSLPPLIVVGAGFLAIMEMAGRGNRRSRSVAAAQPRLEIIALLFVASMAHVPVIPEHLKEAPYMGVLFIGFTLASFVVATVLAFRPALGCYRVVVALCSAAVTAYVATRLIAFPQLADDVGAWAEPLGLVSISTETLAVVLSALALRTHRSAEPRLQLSTSDPRRTA